MVQFTVLKCAKSIIIVALRMQCMRVSPSQSLSRTPSGAPPASAGFSTSINISRNREWDPLIVFSVKRKLVLPFQVLSTMFHLSPSSTSIKICFTNLFFTFSFYKSHFVPHKHARRCPYYSNITLYISPTLIGLKCLLVGVINK